MAREKDQTQLVVELQLQLDRRRGYARVLLGQRLETALTAQLIDERVVRHSQEPALQLGAALAILPALDRAHPGLLHGILDARELSHAEATQESGDQAAVRRTERPRDLRLRSFTRLQGDVPPRRRAPRRS